MAYRAPLQIGARRVLALTCWRCGCLLPADAFDRYGRRRGQRAYIDRRCRVCRWQHLERADVPIRSRSVGGEYACTLLPATAIVATP